MESVVLKISAPDLTKIIGWIEDVADVHDTTVEVVLRTESVPREAPAQITGS